MPVKAFSNSSSSYDKSNKIDTSILLQTLYLRTNYIESNVEEDIDFKNQYNIKKLPDPISIQEAASKNTLTNYSTIQYTKKHCTYKSE